jgi:hypothetical protein
MRVMGEKDRDRDKDYSPNPEIIRVKPKPRETPEVAMMADHAWCKANGTMEVFYGWYPWLRPPERVRRGGRGGR